MHLSEKLKAKVEAYRVSASALEPIRQAPLLFTVGITGAGKNVVLNEVLAKHADKYQFIISNTTRSMRGYETEGVQYYFVDFNTIEGMVDRGEFIETQVVHFDNVYGTTIAEIKRAQDAHKIACTDLEIQGVDEYMALGLNAKAVFLLPPNYDVWQERLLSRYGNAPVDNKDMRNRLQSALTEIQHALDMEHYYIVVNEDLHETAELVHHIASGEPVEPHYHKAVAIAEEMIGRIRAELQRLS